LRWIAHHAAKPHKIDPGQEARREWRASFLPARLAAELD
jgi:hypothetical protein